MKDNYNPNEQSSASQKAQILRHMQNGYSLTPIQALHLFGSLRLPARISEIRSEGWDVKSEFVKLPNGKRVKRYFL